MIINASISITIVLIFYNTYIDVKSYLNIIKLYHLKFALNRISFEALKS